MLNKVTKTNKLQRDHYVVASNKMYQVGNQDGTFTDLGFHVEGEMSGIFAQPIKVSKGYTLSLNNEVQKASSYSLDKGESSFTYETKAGQFVKTVNALDHQKVLCINLNNATKEAQNVSFSIDLKLNGCWTADECGFKAGSTTLVNQTQSGVAVKHEVETAFAGVYADAKTNITVVSLQDGQCVTFEWTLEAAQATNLYVISNNESIEALQAVAADVLINGQGYINEQKVRRDGLLNLTEIQTSETSFDEAFEGLKLNYDMLVQNIDNIGEGYTAGYPDFQWFFGCDTTYGAHGTLAVGQHEMTKQTLRLLKDISWKVNGNGRVIHEVSPFGKIYGNGNLQETPHFITAVYEVYKWTGDKVFLEEMFEFCTMGMDWVETQIKPGSLCPKGPGIVEVHGIDGRVIDIAVLTADAYGQLAYLATEMGRPELVENYQAKQVALQQEIVEKFYCEDEKFFADIICTIDEVRGSRDTLVHSIKNTKTMTDVLATYFDQVLAKDYDKDTLIPLVVKNWITVLPYAQDYVPQYMKEEGLKQMMTPAFYNDYGMKLACLCDDKLDPIHDIYTLNKSMSINTGYLAEVFIKNGLVDEGYELLMKLVRTMGDGMPLTISEILPDDGCFMQFWSGYGIHHVYLRYILGIDVDAPSKTITVKPNLPTALIDVTVKNLKVGECTFQLTYKVVDGIVNVEVTKDREDYTVEIQTGVEN